MYRILCIGGLDYAQHITTTHNRSKESFFSAKRTLHERLVELDTCYTPGLSKPGSDIVEADTPQSSQAAPGDQTRTIVKPHPGCRPDQAVPSRSEGLR